MIRNVVLLIPIVFVAGCATALTADGSKVKLMKADPPSNCKEIEGVSGMSSMWGNMDRAKNQMRNKAAELGANYVRLDTVVGGLLDGTAFKCP